MHPTLFEFGGLRLSTFGPMVVLGFLLSAEVLRRLAARHDPGASAEGYQAVPIWVLVGVLIGARLLYVIVEVARGSAAGREFLASPLLMLAFWQGGLVMYGGLAGGMASGIWCCRRWGIDPHRALDLGLTAAFFGLAVGRIGCLLVGDDYGRAVPASIADWPLPLVVHVPRPLPERSLFGEENAGRALYATQLWMSANGLLLGLLGTRLLRRARRPGRVYLVLILAYAVTRSAIELFRGDAARGVWLGGTLSTSQLISGGAAAAAAIALLKGRRRRAAAPP